MNKTLNDRTLLQKDLFEGFLGNFFGISKPPLTKQEKMKICNNFQDAIGNAYNQFSIGYNIINNDKKYEKYFKDNKYFKGDSYKKNILNTIKRICKYLVDINIYINNELNSTNQERDKKNE